MPADSVDFLPSDLGFPAKFKSYRKHQAGIALDMATGDRRFQMLDAPTGTGKSIIYATAARLLDARTLVLVGTKGLQQQLLADFMSIGMHDIRGQSNYVCRALNIGGEFQGYGLAGTSCEFGPCKAGLFCRRKKDNGCDYYDAQKTAAKSQIVVSNYAYWLSLGRQADPLAIGKFDLLILDEAHTAPDWLAEFCAIELNETDVRKLLDVKLLPISESIESWASWARETADVADEKYQAAKADLEFASTRSEKSFYTHLMLTLSRLKHELEELSKAHSWRPSDGPAIDVRLPGMTTDWVIQETNKGIKFSPVWAHAYAEEYLFRHVPKVILSSATLSPTLGKYLGIPSSDTTWHSVKSGFDPKRRPFIYIPTVRLDHRMVEGQKRQWVNRIDSIINDRLDRKGIIHTVSYARAAELIERSKHKEVMLTHTSHNSRQVIEQFKRAQAPCILVSPSVVEGFDFPHDECRWQIIAKVPFPDGRELVFKARKKSDPDFGNYIAALAITQMVGRSTRSADDASEVFIIDDHWGWMKRRVSWPKWFKESWRVMYAVPPPLALGPLKPSGVKYQGQVRR